jgi:hypothetical protein
MKSVARILSSILALLMLSSGLPLFSPEDANRDQMLGLDDAILQVKDFAGTAEDPGTFAITVERMLSTLHAVAGLNTIIKPAHDKKSIGASFGLDVPYLASFCDKFRPTDIPSSFYEESASYESVSFTPSPPPPQAV